jgi:hypothetical protein
VSTLVNRLNGLTGHDVMTLRGKPGRNCYIARNPHIAADDLPHRASSAINTFDLHTMLSSVVLLGI